MIYNKRHSRFYERVLLSPFFRIAIGIMLLVGITFVLKPLQMLSLQFSVTVFYSITFSLLVYFFTELLLWKIARYPGVKALSYTAPVIILLYAVGVGFFLFARLPYSSIMLGVFFLSTLIYCLLTETIHIKYRRLKIGIVPIGEALNLRGIPSAEWRILDVPAFDGVRYDALVADLTLRLNDDWERFMAQASLANIPVYNVRNIRESLTGRVKVDFLSESDVGSLSPPLPYGYLKRAIDLLAVFLTAPVVLPVVAIAAVVVKLDSHGPALFVQKRVGKGNREFRIYKLRSMTTDSEKNGAQFAGAGDARITKVGHFIRKSRIDELPQLWNVLIGDMSLIGPRPEQKVFVDEFEKSISFYSYRHVVRPGISGWAQVVHGYAASEDDTRLKLEHDLYYIKNFSFWIDALIVFKTLHTMLTGFGAR